MVIVNIKEEDSLFDAKIEIPGNFNRIGEGESLPTVVTMLPMGKETRMDISVTYVVKDFDGNVYLTETETFLVDTNRVFKKDFDTSELPEGDYLVEMNVVYPNGNAVSSAHFKVRRSGVSELLNLLKGVWSKAVENKMIIIIGIVCIVVLILFVCLFKKIKSFKNKKRESKKKDLKKKQKIKEDKDGFWSRWVENRKRKREERKRKREEKRKKKILRQRD